MKTKRFLLLFIALFGLGMAWGQTDIGTSKEWYYEVTNKIVPGYIVEKTYDRYYTDGDTIINDLECTIIRVEKNLAICDHLGESSFYIRQDGSSTLLYNKKTNEFTTLYNFDLNKGDSWETSIGFCTFAMVVDSVGTQTIGNAERKVLFVSDVEEPEHYSGTIVEGIGHLTSFFPRDISCEEEGFCDGLYENLLRCFYENDEQIYSLTENQCDETFTITDITQGADELSDEAIGVLVKDEYIVVTYDMLYSSGTYNIFDYSGRLIAYDELQDVTQIPLTALPKGIYVAKLMFDDNIKVFKFVKR